MECLASSIGPCSHTIHQMNRQKQDLIVRKLELAHPLDFNRHVAVAIHDLRILPENILAPFTVVVNLDHRASRNEMLAQILKRDNTHFRPDLSSDLIC